MRINDVLRRKGSEVLTVSPETEVTGLLGLLAEHGIGAVVVSEGDSGSFVGIVSERDIVRRLHELGVAALSLPVSELMTRDVHTCGLEDQLETLARMMTEHRIRHVPVVQDGKMVGLVSIGDVVKHRLEELQAENTHLSHYISG